MSWAEAARSYLAVLHGPRSRVRWTLTVHNYQFFIDDTGKPEAKFCGAAGYLATGADWDAYLNEWEAALPGDLRNGNFRFQKFVRDVGAGRRPAEQILPLLDVLRARMRHGFARLVHVESWNALPTKYRKLFGHPYSLCIILLLHDVLEEMRSFVDLPQEERLVTVAEYMNPYTPGSPLSVAQEKRRKLEHRTRDLWDFWVEQRGLTGRVQSIIFDDPQRAPQLQAADLQAHASYRVWTRPHRPLRFTGLPDESPSPPFPPTMYDAMVHFLRADAPPHWHGVADYKHLERNFSVFDAAIERMQDRGEDDDPLAQYFSLDPPDGSDER